jgi:hypothetical protein
VLVNAYNSFNDQFPGYYAFQAEAVSDTENVPSKISSAAKMLLKSQVPELLNGSIGSVLDSATPLGDGSYDYKLLAQQNRGPLFWANQIYDLLKDYSGIVKVMMDNPSVSLMEERLGSLLGSELTPNIRYNVWELLSAARNMATDVTLDPWNLSVKTELTGYLEALVNVKRKDDWNPFDSSAYAWGIDGSNITLEPSHLAMLAATSVYTPFRSHVGDEDYIAALRFISGDSTTSSSDQVSDIVSLFNHIKDLRKPLYFRDDDMRSAELSNVWGLKNEEYNGLGYRATLNSLVDAVNRGANTSFFTVRGRFQAAADANSWEFFQAPSVPASSIPTNEADKAVWDRMSESSRISADADVTADVYTRDLLSVGDAQGIWSFTSMAFRNMYQNMRNTSLLGERGDSLLYMNVFGDVVLSDNTVVIPGVANPLIFTDQYGYNPYSVMFMNNYPQLAYDVDTLSVINQTDFRKSILIGESGTVTDVVSYLGSDYSRWNPLNVAYGSSSLITPGAMSGSIPWNENWILDIKPDTDTLAARNLTKSGITFYPYFYGGNTPAGPLFYMFIRFRPFSSLRRATSGALEPLTSNIGDFSNVMLFQQAVTSDNVTLFPYHRDETDPTSNDSFKIPKYIAQNMYWYLLGGAATKSSAVDVYTPGVLDEVYLYENVLVEMLQGSSQVILYEKNASISTKLLGSDADATMDGAKKAARSLFLNFSDVTGVLGIGSAEDNALFGAIIGVLREYALIIFAIFLVIFIFRFIRSGSLVHTVVMTGIAGAFLFLFIYVLPTWLPIGYNAVTNLFTEGLVSDTLLYKAEQYSATYAEAKRVDIESDYDASTASITVDRLSEQELRGFSDRYKIPYDSFRYGGKVVLDPNIGLYVQGGAFKINLDVLLVNNPIQGQYVSVEGSSPSYQLENLKLASSVMDFYTPFYLLEDGLVQTLNSLLSTYTIPRTTSEYLDGFAKDSYVVASYTNSIPFLYPDKYNLIDGLSPMESLKLTAAFPEPSDILNMRDWVNDPDSYVAADGSGIVNTWWYSIMLKNGFYEPEVGEDRRADLIEYVNYHTRRYLIENQPIIGLVSDENLIKVTALQAMLFFNTRISQIGGWSYPLSYNQEDLKLSDVFITALTSNEERYVKHNFDLVSYVADGYGVVGLVLLIILLGASMLFVLVIQYSLPILYILLAVFVTVRLLTNRPLGGVVRGYAKVSIGVILIYTLFVVSLSQLPSVITGTGLFVALAIIAILLLYVLVVMFVGFFSDFLQMGNSGIAAAFERAPLTGALARPYQAATRVIPSSIYATNVAPVRVNAVDGTYARNSYSAYDTLDLDDFGTREYILRALRDDTGVRFDQARPDVRFSRQRLSD